MVPWGEIGLRATARVAPAFRSPVADHETYRLRIRHDCCEIAGLYRRDGEPVPYNGVQHTRSKAEGTVDYMRYAIVGASIARPPFPVPAHHTQGTMAVRLVGSLGWSWIAGDRKGRPYIQISGSGS